MDGLTVNGKSFDFNTLDSSDPSTPKGKAVANLDTGYTFGPIAKTTLDFIYSSIPGAVYSEVDSQWVVPCMGAANVSFNFGGQEISIHRLDLTSIQVLSAPNGTNVTVCQSAFVAAAHSRALPGIDLLLGDAFLKNVYAVFYFGDYVQPEDSLNVTDPYIQLLATTTDTADAHKDFQYSRFQMLKNLPPTLTPDEYITLLNSVLANSETSSASKGGNRDAELLSAESASSSDPSGWNTIAKKLDHYGPAVLGLLAGNLLIGVILAVIGISLCVRRGVG